MVTPLELHTATLARLRAVPQLAGRVFDDAPEEEPVEVREPDDKASDEEPVTEPATPAKGDDTVEVTEPVKPEPRKRASSGRAGKRS
jgi:hypothetical protein